MSQEQPTQRKPRWTGESIALFVIGLLLLVPSGLCTTLVGLPFAFSGNFYATDAGLIRVFLVFGFILIALGASLVYAGLKSRRRD